MRWSCVQHAGFYDGIRHRHLPLIVQKPRRGGTRCAFSLSTLFLFRSRSIDRAARSSDCLFAFLLFTICHNEDNKITWFLLLHMIHSSDWMMIVPAWTEPQDQEQKNAANFSLTADTHPPQAIALLQGDHKIMTQTKQTTTRCPTTERKTNNVGNSEKPRTTASRVMFFLLLQYASPVFLSFPVP